MINVISSMAHLNKELKLITNIIKPICYNEWNANTNLPYIQTEIYIIHF